MEIFLDTSFLVAFYNKRDQNHSQARKFIAEIDIGISFVISDYIFDEVLTVLLVRGGKFLSIEAGQLILEDDRIDLLQIDDQVFQKAWIVYHGFKDKEWSFTDCTSYVLMKNLSMNTGVIDDNYSWRSYCLIEKSYYMTLGYMAEKYYRAVESMSIFSFLKKPFQSTPKGFFKKEKM